MNFQKTINQIEQLCVQADSMILQGQNSDKKFTLYLRETTEKILREFFKEIKHKMNKDYISDYGIEGVIVGAISLIAKNESLLKQTATNKNRADDANKKIQNFEQKWLSSIHLIHESDIDKLFRVLQINHKSGYGAALAYLRGEMKIPTTHPFDQKIRFF